MKIIVVYDSRTGNTEKMAKGVAEGARSVARMEVDVKKIGEPFSLTMLAKADGVIFGSPCNYANVTPAMLSFLENLKGAAKKGTVDVKGKKAAIFGSYGWDGAYVMEDLFKKAVQNIGFQVKPEVCVEVDTNIQYHPDDHQEKCRIWGQEFAESLK